ncbi:hypothetical protein LCGC14_2320120, partial [marine sediment metagenome]
PGTPYIYGWHIDALAEHLEAVTRGEIRNLLITMPPRHAKALAHDTPIFTTWGWKRHGDLVPGDFVFTPKGLPVRVIAVTDEFYDEAYEIGFDDGETIIAGSQHEWRVYIDDVHSTPKWKRTRTERIVETAQLRQHSDDTRNRRAARIKLTSAVQCPPKRLLIDPYLLGVWLGDGSSTSAMLYAGEEDASHFESLGRVARVLEPMGTRKQKFFHILPEGLQTKLRVLGLLGNKHIPSDYLEASLEQRLSLLQGLMDTDGTCSKSDGRCSFTTKHRHIADDICQLICSLGLKAYISREKYTRLNGRVHGPYFIVSFMGKAGLTIFRLQRKQSRIRESLHPKSNHRYVHSLIRIGQHPLKCIQVEGGMYLTGKRFIPTHNSICVAVMWPTWVWTCLPEKRFLFASYAQGLSTRDSVKCRRIIESPWYRRRWGHVFKLTSDMNLKMRFENSRMGYRLATSVGGSNTGEGGDFLGVDDAHNIKEVSSKIKRTAVID